MVHQSQKYRDTEKIWNTNPGFSNIIANSLGGAGAQKIKDNYLDRNYNIVTYGSPNLSISDQTPTGITRYTHIGVPIASLDRVAQAIGADLNSFEAHYFSNSPYISGDVGKWVIGDTKHINTPWDSQKSIYTTPPITQTDLDNNENY